MFFLSIFRRSSEIGAYAVAYSLAEAFWVVTDSLEAALFVDLTRLEDPSARRETRRALRLYGVLAVCTAAALVAGFAILRSEFEAKYPRGIAIFPWVLGAAIVRGVSQPFSSYLYSRGRGRRVLGSRVTGLAVNAALCLLWIPTTGALGAARATLASYVTEAVLLTALARARSRPVDPPASVP